MKGQLNTNMVIKEVRNYKIKAQSNAEVEKIEQMMETEEYYKEEFRKYFHVWVQQGTGVYYFIKEKYFVSRNGISNYAIALLQYGSRTPGLVESEIPIQK